MGHWKQVVLAVLLWTSLNGWGRADSVPEAEGKKPPANRPTIEQILQVWNARQSKVKSAKYEMNLTETIAKGSASQGEPIRRNSGKVQESGPNPPQDYLVEGKAGVSLSDVRARYWYDHQQWDPTEKMLYPEHWIEVFDGEHEKHLVTPASAQHNYPLAVIRKVSSPEAAKRFPIFPLVLTFRGNHPKYFQQLGEHVVSEKPVSVLERPCWELVKTSDTGDVRDVFYLDQERDYVVVRRVVLHGNQPTWQIDVRYSPDTLAGWSPTSWEYSIRTDPKGPPVQSGRFTVTQYKLNPNLPDSEFDIELPAKARVIDESDGAEVQYVIGEDGKPGRKIPTSSNPAYDDLTKPAPRFSRTSLLMIWGGIFVLALLGVLWLRQRRKALMNEKA